MRYISELIDKGRAVGSLEDSVVLPGRDRIKKSNRVNLIALGDVGGTVLMGLRLLGGDVISSIGIYDLNESVVKRYEMEINQICFPDGRPMPEVTALGPERDDLYDCDMLVFCATKGVPPVNGAEDVDVRMVQLKANGELVAMYASEAADHGFSGIFAVVSDPVDPLCAAALKAGLEPEQVQGYGLGVMNGRASYYARRDERFTRYLSEGRAFGPHGEDLVIADSVRNYDDEISRELTELTVRANMEVRAGGFKPYIAPALSSGAISLVETLRGGWNYSSVYLGGIAGEKQGGPDGRKTGDDRGCEGGQAGEGSQNCGDVRGRLTGAFLGCRNRRCREGIELEDLPLDDRLFRRIERAYENLKKLV